MLTAFGRPSTVLTVVSLICTLKLFPIFDVLISKVLLVTKKLYYCDSDISNNNLSISLSSSDMYLAAICFVIAQP